MQSASQRTTTLQLELVSLASGEELVISQLRFSQIKYVALYLNEVNVLREDERFEDSWLVWEELRNSTRQSGKYLLFTALTGIADEGGWEYVQVGHQDAQVEWVLFRDEGRLHYVFAADAYLAAVQHIEQLLTFSPKNIPLQPSHVIYPET